MIDQTEAMRSLTNHSPTNESVIKIEDVRVNAKDLMAAIFNRCPESRERSIAITKLEESTMWAVKAIILGDHGSVAK